MLTSIAGKWLRPALLSAITGRKRPTGVLPCSIPAAMRTLSPHSSACCGRARSVPIRGRGVGRGPLGPSTIPIRHLGMQCAGGRGKELRGCWVCSLMCWQGLLWASPAPLEGPIKVTHLVSGRCKPSIRRCEAARSGPACRPYRSRRGRMATRMRQTPRSGPQTWPPPRQMPQTSPGRVRR